MTIGLYVNKFFTYMAEKSYNMARRCEARAIAINAGITKKHDVFGERKSRFPGMHVDYGIFSLDPKDPEVREGLIRGWRRSPKVAISDAVWSDGRRIHSDRNLKSTVVKLGTRRKK